MILFSQLSLGYTPKRNVHLQIFGWFDLFILAAGFSAA